MLKNVIPRPGRRRYKPAVEVVEKRALMATGLLNLLGGGTGAISGSVLLASNASGQSGATIQLYAQNGTTLLQTITTDSYGNYSFSNLSPGNYVVKEVAPAGYTNDGASPISPVNPATAAGIDTIDVTVVNASNLSLTSSGALAGSTANVQVKANLKSSSDTAGVYLTSLGTSSGSSNLSSGNSSFLIGTSQNLSAAGGETLSVQALPLSSLSVNLLGISASSTGRIGYLVNQYGNTPLTAVQGAGLQLAIWELIYGQGNPLDFLTGGFQATGPGSGTTSAQFTQIEAQATAYLNQSSGQSEPALFLDPTPDLLGLNAACGVIVPSSLDFINKSAPNIVPSDNVNLAISNISYAVNGVNVGPTLAGNVAGAATVSVTFTIPAGQQGRFTLAVYSTDAQFDLGSQYIYNYQTSLFGAGVHTLKIQVQNVNSEIYFIHGSPLNSFNETQGVDYFDTNQYIDSAIVFATTPTSSSNAKASGN